MLQIFRALVSVVVLACSSVALAAEPFTALTMKPYLANEVNALELNHLYLQSLFALDSTPFTLGAGIRSAPASYLRTDGEVTDAGLGKAIYVLAIGAGRPRSGFAVFGGLNLSNVRPSGYPNVTAQSGDADSFISAQGGSSVVFLGVAYKGLALEVAQFATEQKYDADGHGRFVAGGCDPDFGCGGRTTRAGGPIASSPVTTEIDRQSVVANVESIHGYSAAVIVTPKQPGVEKTTLTGFRLLAQPSQLARYGLGALGAGLNSYDAGVDYYGDQLDALNEAAASGGAIPDAEEGRLYEIPLVSDDIAGTGINGRIAVQVAPKAAFRLAEVGYAAQASGSWLIPQVGGRAKMFLRDESYVPSVDAYAGVFWLFDQDEPDDDDNGLSVYASYSYNSPDSLTFVPLADAHVIGLQMVYGNPLGLPPPVPILKYPALDSRHAAREAAENVGVPAKTEGDE
jgi:hypothetical protein